MTQYKDEIVKFLTKRVYEYYGRTVVVDEQQALVDLGLDSLDLIEIWIDLESYFKIDIPEEESKNIKTVKDIIDLVNKYRK